MLTPADQRMNKNFQIEGRKNEKLIVRVFYNEIGVVKKVRYYTWEIFDEEMADYLVKALLFKIGKSNIDYCNINIKRIGL